MLKSMSAKSKRLYGLQQSFDDGKTAYYFVLIPEQKEKYFLRLLKGKEEFDLKDMGDIVHSGYGVPDKELIKQLSETYDVKFIQ